MTSATSVEVDGSTRVTWRNHAATIPEAEEVHARPPARSARPGRTPSPVVDAPPPLRVDADVLRIARFAAINEELSLQHIDKDFARNRLRLPTTNVMGWLKLGLLATMLDLWAGFGAVRRLEARYLGIDFAGDVLTAAAAREGGTFTLAITNKRGETNTVGRAELAP